MTPAEIEADIARRAEGGPAGNEANIAQRAEGGPANIDRRDGDQRAAGHALRTAIRDEILAARATDPAGWAMRDDAVAATFTAAQENPDNPALASNANQQRLALQREMGIAQPRLLSDAERDEIAGQLAHATPADRPAIIADLRARYGPQYDGLVKELSGRVAPDTGVLMAHAGDSPLTGALARGMAMDSVEFTGARVLTLPMIDGKLDSSRLEDKQLYTFMAGDRVVSVIYDRKADALAPALAEASGEVEGDNSGQPGRIVSAIHGAGQEAVNIVAAVPKSQAFFAAEISRRTLEDMLAIQMDEEPFWVHRNHADKATLIRFRQASPEERLRMLADQASVFPQDSAFYKFGEAISAYAREALPTNPDYEDELFQKLARAGGGLGGLIFVGGVLRRAGIPPVVTVAATGATTQMVAQFEDALQSGATMEEAYDAANLGALVGLTEALPIARLFDRLDKGTGGSIRRALIEAAKGGAEEALQETFQTVMKSLIASDLVGYDPDRRIFEGLDENAGISFTLGGVVNFVAAIAGGRRSASNGQAREDSAQGDAPGVDTIREDLGNAPSGEALAEEGVSGVETVAGSDPVVSIAESVIDDDLIAGYDKTSRHENFRDADAPFAEEGQAGRNAFGLIDPESGKPIIQPINDAEQMLAMAAENVQPLTQQLKGIVADLPGVEFSSARAKKPDRLGRKLAGGRRPDTLGDYLGGRIVVDDPSMLSEAVRVLAGRYKNIEIDNFIKKPREIGYRAIHMQIVLDNGMTAEIQIMPREILPVYEFDHENYEKWRDIDTFTEEEMNQKEADEAWAREAYAEAYERWLQRGDTTSTWPKNR